MAALKERLKAKVDRLRERRPFVDHVITMVEHYGNVNGNAQAGAVTFFGFLSFFPILALGFFVIGYISKVYPDAQQQLVEALDKVLPGVVGNGPDEIPLSTFASYAGAIGVIGLAGVLYSGLGWLSGMRDALEVMFVLPKREQPNFVIGKARDLAALAVIGITLIVSVALSGAVSGLSKQILTWLGLNPESAVPNGFLWLLAHGLAIVATTILLIAMFRLLAQPHLPRRALLQGALLGAIGFEILKSLASFLIVQTKDQPAFQAFGVALILVVWINYFSRLVMYSAAWAFTAPVAQEERAADAVPVLVRHVPGSAAAVPQLAAGIGRHRADAEPDGHRKAFAAAGAAAGLAAVGAVALKRHHDAG